MNITGIKTLVTSKVARSVLNVKRVSPDILLYAGVAGVVGAAVMACRATAKSLGDFESHRRNFEMIQDEKDDFQSKEEYGKALAVEIGSASLTYLRAYGPSIVVGSLSIYCLVGGHQILKTRNAALAAAYKIVDETYKRYRGRVVEEFGVEKDREFSLDSRQEAVTRTDDDGGSTLGLINTIEQKTHFSQYAKCFDETNPQWDPNPEYNLVFLKSQQAYANNMLTSRGHLFLNEVYDMLGIPRTKAGAVVGWAISKDADNFVDFGLYNEAYQSNRDFINGYEKAVWLDFNVQGVIYDLI